MNSMPLLSSHNRFNVLHVEQINNIETEIQDVQKPDPCCNKSQIEALPSATFSVLYTPPPTPGRVQVESELSE